jgi:hypothetical protein
LVTAQRATSGVGCVISVTATWDRARIAGVGFGIFDSRGVPLGFVDGGAITLDPRPARAGSLSWSTTSPVPSGEFTVEAHFFDQKGFDVVTSTETTTC